jgi:hypothetical protein
MFVALTLLAFSAGAAAQGEGAYVSFVACPIARDTGPDTDVCFLAEYQGRRYALVNPPDWGVPQLGHRVLVEGTAREGPKICGAIPIEGRVSPMPELDASCGQILPFDGEIKGASGGVFNSGSPRQREYAQDLARRAQADPRLSIEPAILDPVSPPTPQPPFERRELSVIYPFNSTRGSGPDMIKLRELAIFAQVAHARQVSIAGFRTISRLSDGSTVEESESLAEARAVKLGDILKRLGVNPRSIHVRWETKPVGGSGQEDWRFRKADISVSP